MSFHVEHYKGNEDIGNNGFGKDMREFSHMLYGLVYALDLLDESEAKITKEDLGKCLEKALEKKVNHPYLSAIETSEFSAKDFSLNDEKVHNIVKQAKNGIINLLVIGLCDLLDECLSGKIEMDSSKNLCKRIEEVHLDKKYEWSAKGVHELRIIRNCIVHNKCLFSKTAIQELKKYVDKDSNAIENKKVYLCFEDIFRFRRAVRTFINEAKKE